MKKFILPLLIVLIIALTACSAASTGTPIGSTSTDLPSATELAVGTLKLAGTDQAVTADQAKSLVVYWQVYEQLTQSDTAAQAEIDGLLAQIQETMTESQLQAIQKMNITQQDVVTSMQGVTVTVSNASNSTVNASTGSAGGAGMPAGGPPADGGGAPQDSGMPADMGGAAPASSAGQTPSSQTGSASTGTTGIPSALIEAVIQSLQQVISA